MWYCYTIKKANNFKHLSLVTKDLQKIYNFITELTKIDSESFDFEIIRKEVK